MTKYLFSIAMRFLLRPLMLKDDNIFTNMYRKDMYKKAGKLDRPRIMRCSIKVYIRHDNEGVEPEVGRAYKLLDFADYRNS